MKTYKHKFTGEVVSAEIVPLQGDVQEWAVPNQRNNGTFRREGCMLDIYRGAAVLTTSVGTFRILDPREFARDYEGADADAVAPVPKPKAKKVSAVSRLGSKKTTTDPQ